MLVTPTSFGSITLNTSSPFDFPTIDPAFLSTPFDVQALRYALRSSVRFATAHAWSGVVTGQAGPFADIDVVDDSALDAWARSQASTIWHPTGTARMGPQNWSNAGVVDSQLRVWGVAGLRVVDAGVMVGLYVSLLSELHC